MELSLHLSINKIPKSKTNKQTNEQNSSRSFFLPDENSSKILVNIWIFYNRETLSLSLSLSLSLIALKRTKAWWKMTTLLTWTLKLCDAAAKVVFFPPPPPLYFLLLIAYSLLTYFKSDMVSNTSGGNRKLFYLAKYVKWMQSPPTVPLVVSLVKAAIDLHGSVGGGRLVFEDYFSSSTCAITIDTRTLPPPPHSSSRVVLTLPLRLLLLLSPVAKLVSLLLLPFISFLFLHDNGYRYYC